MSNKNLFQEAIADAKAVREAALANAKAALEEALTPKIQSMLAAKLNEMEYEEEGLKDEEEMEEGMYPDTTTDPIQDRYRATGAALEGKEEELEEIDLSAILAELEDEGEEEEEYEELEEAKEEEEEEEGEEEEEEDGEEKEEEVEVADMTVDELKDLIKDIVAQEMGGGEEMMDMGAEAGEEAPSGEEEEINLDELLAELDALDEMKDEEELEEVKKKSKHEKGETKAEEKAEHASGKEKKEKSEMKEAIATIQALRNELNEVNLLNAKLLYVNKIFKSKNLTESQKVHVIASFDKATNVREAKVVFESLSTALTAATKKPIKESLGFASKAAGIAPSKVIVESNDAIARMQKLANIIK